MCNVVLSSSCRKPTSSDVHCPSMDSHTEHRNQKSSGGVCRPLRSAAGARIQQLVCHYKCILSYHKCQLICTSCTGDCLQQTVSLAAGTRFLAAMLWKPCPDQQLVHEWVQYPAVSWVLTDQHSLTLEARKSSIHSVSARSLLTWDVLFDATCALQGSVLSCSWHFRLDSGNQSWSSLNQYRQKLKSCSKAAGRLDWSGKQPQVNWHARSKDNMAGC